MMIKSKEMSYSETKRKFNQREDKVHSEEENFLKTDRNSRNRDSQRKNYVYFCMIFLLYLLLLPQR